MLLTKMFNKVSVTSICIIIFCLSLFGPFVYFKYVPKQIIITRYIVTDKYIDNDRYYLVIDGQPTKTDSCNYNNIKLNVILTKEERGYTGFNYYLDKFHTILCYFVLIVISILVLLLGIGF